MKDPFSTQHTLGIMKSVKLGPAMNQKTYELIRNFNNGWVTKNDQPYEEQLKIVNDYQAVLGRVFVQVKLHGNVKSLIDLSGESDFIYYAADVYPVCRCMSVREKLLDTLDRLVSQQDRTATIYALHSI